MGAMSSEVLGVLVVDDEPADRDAIAETLQSTGRFAVYTAPDFPEAARVYAERSADIHLAILDVSLPGRNGVELAKHLLDIDPNLRVLFISGHVGAEVIRFHGINALAEHFLQKPFDGPTLLRRVQQSLDSRTPLHRVLSASDLNPSL